MWLDGEAPSTLLSDLVDRLLPRKIVGLAKLPSDQILFSENAILEHIFVESCLRGFARQRTAQLRHRIFRFTQEQLRCPEEWMRLFSLCAGEEKLTWMIRRDTANISAHRTPWKAWTDALSCSKFMFTERNLPKKRVTIERMPRLPDYILDEENAISTLPITPKQSHLTKNPPLKCTSRKVHHFFSNLYINETIRAA